MEQQVQPQAQPGQLTFSCMSRWPTWAHTGQLSLLCLPGIQNRLEGRHSLWSCTDTLFTGKSWWFFSPLRIIRVSHQAQAGSNNPFWHGVWRKCLTARAEQCSGWNVRSREWVQKTTHVITLLKYVGWIWGRCSVLSSLWEYTEVFPRLSWILLQALVSAETRVSLSQQHFSIHD